MSEDIKAAFKLFFIAYLSLAFSSLGVYTLSKTIGIHFFGGVTAVLPLLFLATVLYLDYKEG